MSTALNKLYRNIINFLIIAPFPNALFGLSNNILPLAYLSFLIVFMLLLLGSHFAHMKIKTGLLLIYILIFCILTFNLTQQFALTFSVRILFAITAGWFLFAWNSSANEVQFARMLKATLYVIGAISLVIFVIHPPEDGRLTSLFDVHTSKYFFFVFVVIFTHRVLRNNRTGDYVALVFSFLLLTLSLQRGILMTAIAFLLLTFREKVFRKLTWVILAIIAAFAMGVFDPLINRLFYKGYSGGSFRDMLSNINSSGRLEFWSYLWNNEKISFFGNGLGYAIDIGKERFVGLNLVHNDFLWILIDIGIFGFASLILIFFYLLRSVGRIEDKILKRVYFSLLLSILLVMFVDNFIIHIYVYFPLLFAYLKLQENYLINERKSHGGNIQLG